MNPIQRIRGFFAGFFAVQHHYDELPDRVKARGLVRLNSLFMLAIVVGLGVVINVAATTNSTGVGAPPLLTVALRLIVLLGFMQLSAVGVNLLVNSGRLAYAGLFFTALLILLTLQAAGLAGFNLINVVVYTVPLAAAITFIGIGTTWALLGMSLFIIAGGLIAQATGLSAGLDVLPLGPIENFVIVSLVLALDVLILSIGFAVDRALKRQVVQMNDRLDALATFDQLFVANIGLSDMLDDTVELIRDQLGFLQARIYLVESVHGIIVEQAVSGGTTGMSGNLRILATEQHGVAFALREGVALTVSMSDPDWMRHEWLPLTRTAVLIPIQYQGAKLGLLEVQSTLTPTASTVDVTTLNMIGTKLALLVYNARLSEQIRKLHQENNVLKDHVHAADATASATGLAGGVSRLGGDRAEGNLIGYDWQRGLLKANRAITPELVSGSENPLPETKQVGNESVLTVPITLRGAVLGVAEFRSDQGAGWTSRQIELARVISQRLALALDNLRLLEQSQQTATRERLAASVMSRLQTRTDVDSLIELATSTFQTALGAAQTTIRLGVPTTTLAAPSATDQNGSAT